MRRTEGLELRVDHKFLALVLLHYNPYASRSVRLLRCWRSKCRGSWDGVRRKQTRNGWLLGLGARLTAGGGFQGEQGETLHHIQRSHLTARRPPLSLLFVA